MEAAVRTNVDSLHLDGALCTLCSLWNPRTGLGCFCDDVVGSFNDYLQQNYSPLELTDLGVEDLQTFHYRRHLQQLYPEFRDYEKAFHSGTIPLMDKYRSHQFQLISDLYRELIARFRQRTGKHMALGANLNSVRFNMLPPVVAVDYLYCEMRYTETSDYEVMAFKIAEALDKPFSAFADGRSIRAIRKERIPNLLKRWIGLTYGMGANFGIPSLRALRLSKEELADLRFDRSSYIRYFSMIHAHPELFDGYEPFGQVAVLFSNRQQWHEPLLGFNEFCRKMLDTNYQFNLVIAGDDRLKCQLRAEALDDYEAIIVAGDPRLDAAQQAALATAGDRVRYLPLKAHTENIRNAMSDIRPAVGIPADIPVWALTRIHPESDRNVEKPIVIHLVNRQFDKKNNRHIPIGQFQIELNPRLLHGGSPSSVELITPERGFVPCRIVGTSVTVPALDVWGILKVNQ